MLLLFVIIANATEQKVVIEKAEVKVTQPKEELPKLKEIAVCNSSSVKTYMDYRMITSKSSKQYRYIKEHMQVNEKGLLVDKDGYIGIALGNYWGVIGDKFIFTLDSGVVLSVVKIEVKADQHMINKCYQKWDKSVIEIVGHAGKMADYYGRASNNYVLSGNFNNHDDFKGRIVKVEKVVE